MTEEVHKPGPRQAERGTARGWIGAALPGFALVSVAVMFSCSSASSTRSTTSRSEISSRPIRPPLGACSDWWAAPRASTLSIVIVAVVFGIQTTSSRYSPRIIGIFTRNPLNALVLSFALASILYTFLVRGEVKVNSPPM